MGTFTCMRFRCGQGVLVCRLGAGYRNFVILGIDFDQWRSCFHILVVVNQQLHDVPGDARADGVQVSIDLRVVG